MLLIGMEATPLCHKRAMALMASNLDPLNVIAKQ